MIAEIRALNRDDLEEELGILDDPFIVAQPLSEDDAEEFSIDLGMERLYLERSPDSAIAGAEQPQLALAHSTKLIWSCVRVRFGRAAASRGETHAG